jgi:hypothetical protein
MIVQFRLAIGPIYVRKRKLGKGDVLGDPSFWIDVVVVSNNCTCEMLLFLLDHLFVASSHMQTVC